MRKQINKYLGVILVSVLLCGCGAGELSLPSSTVTENVETEMPTESEIEAQETTEMVVEEQDVKIQEPEVPEIKITKEAHKEEPENRAMKAEEEKKSETPEVEVSTQVEEVVSNNVVENEKDPLEQEPEIPNTPTIEQSKASEVGSFYAVYSEAEMNEVLNQGDLATYFQMLNANSAATMGGVHEVPADTQPSEYEKLTDLSVDFVDYMNTRRLEQGLSAYVWSDSMANTALERAEEIVADFSHNGTRNCAGENLTMINSSNVADWYDIFYSSEVHKLNMLDATYHSAAAASCQVGNTNYVVVLFGF